VKNPWKFKKKRCGKISVGTCENGKDGVKFTKKTGKNTSVELTKKRKKYVRGTRKKHVRQNLEKKSA